ncbi:hypothetical protein TUN199_11328 [Pyrenophora tritici-repentis]|nr:hypothetical protein TUN205_11332 [Pyrenophora tritici-repentis]KAI0616680.1 hypothetical protein TUN199_11328 [Pyrenophora tritici-repentis]
MKVSSILAFLPFCAALTTVGGPVEAYASLKTAIYFMQLTLPKTRTFLTRDVNKQVKLA